MTDSFIEITEQIFNFLNDSGIPDKDHAHFWELMDEFSKGVGIGFIGALRNMIINSYTYWALMSTVDIKDINVSYEIIDLLEGHILTSQQKDPIDNEESVRWCLQLIPHEKEEEEDGTEKSTVR